MPVPPKRLKELVEGTVDHHASLTHPDPPEITIRWRGGYGDLAARAGTRDENDEQIHLCRIEYLGNDDTWALAIYDPVSDTYTDARLTTGHTTGSPTDAYDTAALVHLTDYRK
jgi:hypothetical protein